jgi:hypothetical protein
LHNFLTAQPRILSAMSDTASHVKLSRWFTRLVAFVILSVSGGALAHQWLERNQPVVMAQTCKGNACGTTETVSSAVLPERRSEIAAPTIIGEIPEFTLELPRPVLEFLLPIVTVLFVPIVFARTRQPRAPPVTA